MSTKIVKNIALLSLISLPFALSAQAMDDSSDKNIESGPTSTPSTPCPFDILEDINVGDIADGLITKAKELSSKDEHIDFPLIMDTFNLFMACDTKILHTHISNIFFPKLCNVSNALRMLRNEHLIAQAEKKLKLELFEQIKSIAKALGKGTKEEELEIEIKELKSIFPNYANLLKLAQKKNTPKVSQVLKEIGNPKKIRLGTLHLENFAKQLQKSHHEITEDWARSKLLEYLNAPLLVFIKTYMQAKSAEKELDFFKHAFSRGCKIIRLMHLQTWALQYIHGHEEEDEWIVKAKGNVQTEDTPTFNQLTLNARILYFANSLCKQPNIQDIYDLQDQPEETLMGISEYIYDLLNSFEKGKLDEQEVHKGSDYIFNLIKNFE